MWMQFVVLLRLQHFISEHIKTERFNFDSLLTDKWPEACLTTHYRLWSKSAGQFQ